MDYEAAVRSDRYFSDVLSEQTNEVPGRPLAEAIAKMLEARGYECVVVDESPLWIVRTGCDGEEVEVIVSLYEPSKEPRDAVWNVSLPSKRSFWERLFGRPESGAITKLALAVHSALEAIDGLEDIRWFRKWPAEPYSCSQFSRTPQVGDIG